MEAVNIGTANIVSGGDCGSLLMYKGIIVKTYYAEYLQDGVNYPAYCLDKTKQGVTNDLSYSVSVNNAITDVKLWRIIINGYPYKTIKELGCANKEEAFTATKQAIYCHIHGNNPQDYSPIGEAGNRTLNALNKILSDAGNCQEMQISNIIKINKEQEQFEIDEKQSEYVSKVYSISAETAITNYKILINNIQEGFLDGIKVTDLNNREKQEFNQNEKFKILIPLKSLTEKGNFTINVQTKINNKPVLYGKANNSTYQDYALTAATYEDAIGNVNDVYYKNETKVKIIKQDKDTEERLENVEFRIFDKNKNIVYSNLKTNANGEILINNLIPGKYFIQEINSKEGYILDNDLLEFDVMYNQELVLTITNSLKSEEIPKTVDKQEVSKDVIRRLPITGM